MFQLVCCRWFSCVLCMLMFMILSHLSGYSPWVLLGAARKRHQDHSEVDLSQYLVIFHYKTNIAEGRQTEISGCSECGNCGTGERIECVWDYGGFEPRLTRVVDPDTSLMLWSDPDRGNRRGGSWGISLWTYTMLTERSHRRFRRRERIKRGGWGRWKDQRVRWWMPFGEQDFFFSQKVFWCIRDIKHQLYWLHIAQLPLL